MKTRPFNLRAFLFIATLGLIAASPDFTTGVKEPHKREGARKSSGGSGRRIKRQRANTRYHSWKKCFGGLAVPDFIG